MRKSVLGRRRLAAAMASGCAVLAALCAAAVLDNRVEPANPAFVLVSLLTGAAFNAVGALLLGVRPGNALGPLLSVCGGAVVGEYALRENAYVGLREDPGSLPWPDVAGWAGFTLDPLFFPVPIALILLLFPDGRVPWRPLRWAALAGGGVALAMVLLTALRRGPLPDETFRYPVPWRGVLPVPVEPALAALNQTGIVLLGVSVVTLLVRYFRSAAEDRQRLKPLALVGSAAVLFLAVQPLPGLRPVGVAGLVVAVAIGLPAALAVGALRYRVWDLDRVLVAAIVYGALAILVTGVYVVVVVALAGARGSTAASLPSIVATALVAVVFAPARDRVGRVARRLVYGVRATPYEALAALPHRLAEAPAVDDVLPRTARALTEGLGLPRARVRAFLAEGADVAWSPAEPASPAERASPVERASPAEPGSLPDPAGDRGALEVVDVRHLGEVVGDVAVQPWPDRPLGTADRRLLADLAAQAGPALRAVALAGELRARLDQITAQSAELRASRQRIVAAQVEERRRLERDIHDGAQQQLVGLAVRLRAAEDLVATDPAAGQQALRHCRDELDRCLDDLRDLAQGVYPPVLAARGLPAALRARARMSAGEVRVVAAPELAGRRFAAQIEVAAYFVCLEAMQNAAKYAPGAAVLVELSTDGDGLSFAVSDEGPGFAPGTAIGRGSGLLGMADRLGAVGGTLTVDSAPGRGTVVRGRLAALPDGRLS